MADDAVVEIGDVERPVRTELDVHGPEPEVVATNKVRLLDRPGYARQVRAWHLSYQGRMRIL